MVVKRQAQAAWATRTSAQVCHAVVVMELLESLAVREEHAASL